MAKPRKNPSAPIQRKQDQAQVSASIRQLAIRRTTSGPLPDAASFAAYEATTPGAGERILAMAEQEQRHRHECEKACIETQREDQRASRSAERRGQWFALVAAMAMLGVGALLVYTDHPLYGTLVSGGTIIGVISSFLQNRETQNKTHPPATPTPERKDLPKQGD